MRNLRRELVAGVFLPGQKLHIAALAVRYGVGPGAVREALSALVSEGLVTSHAQRGFRAAPISPESLIDLTRVRIHIDVHGLTLAIAAGRPGWVDEVRACQDRLEAAEAAGGLGSEEWTARHRDFHRSIVAGSGSEHLLRIHDQLFQQSERYRALAARHIPGAWAPRDRDIAGEHAAIVAAVASSDVEAAGRALQGHYTRTTDIVLGLQHALAGLDRQAGLPNRTAAHSTAR
jgi:DNA-binding GntR family transcriptional regulator